MNFDQVLELVKTVSASELTAFQYEEGNQKITMQSGGVFQEMNSIAITNDTAVVSNVSENAQTSVTASASVTTEAPAVSATVTASGEVVTSPLVGRFYTAPSEEADVFVKVGDTVKKGRVLAIVEAMKLMNEIECDYDGVVAEVLADNGQGVEYGQPLFRIAV